jgi:hypothetical protein
MEIIRTEKIGPRGGKRVAWIVRGTEYATRHEAEIAALEIRSGDFVEDTVVGSRNHGLVVETKGARVFVRWNGGTSGWFARSLLRHLTPIKIVNAAPPAGQDTPAAPPAGQDTPAAPPAGQDTPAAPPELRDAYRWHRQRRAYLTASNALARAREDVAAGVRRYPHNARWPFPAISRQPDNPSLAFVEDPAAAGLRFVGAVDADNREWSRRDPPRGWYTDPDGDACRDGSGLCWGEVYQLPARRGVARFVAAYRMGGTADGLVVDFGTIHTTNARDPNGYSQSERYTAEETDVVTAADELARIAAEHEREYQEAWRAGSDWSDAGDRIANDKRELRSILTERRTIGKKDPRFPALCRTIKARVLDLCERITATRKERDNLIDSIPRQLRTAFNDGAGKVVL